MGRRLIESALTLTLAALVAPVALAAYGQSGFGPYPKDYNVFMGLYAFGLIAFGALLALAAAIALLVLWVMMIIDCAYRDFPNKTVWLTVLALSAVLHLHLLTGPLYYFLVKRRGLGTLSGQPPSAASPPPTGPTLNTIDHR